MKEQQRGIFILNLLEKGQTAFIQRADKFPNFGLQNLRISETEHCNTPTNSYISDVSTDPLEVLKKFLAVFGQRIKEIDLDFYCSPRHDNKLQLVQTIFKECTNLQQITIWNNILESLQSSDFSERCSAQTLKIRAFGQRQPYV